MGISPNPEYEALISSSFTAISQTLDFSQNEDGQHTLQATGTWVGTILIEVSNDSSTWITLSFLNASTNLKQSSITANGVYVLPTTGFAACRARSSAWTSGTAVLTISGANVPGHYDPTYGNNSTPVPAQGQLVMGSDGTNGVPLAVDSLGRLVTSSLTGFGAGFTFGDVTTSALTRVLVKRTTYTEQTSNAQRSIVSANANDTAAGTGARTVLLTYLNAAGTLATETLTLNGTTPVNTVSTTICYIENIKVLTAGSGGANAGIITLKAATAGGGATIWTIATGDNQTFGAHHYVPVSKTCNITGISCGHNGTTVGSGALFTIHMKDLATANSIESQVSDFVRLYGQTSTFSRIYQSPIKVIGPARLQMYVTPETASSTIYRSAFDFFEP